MKKVVTIQDISCVGKRSLTVALPIISALGIETAVIPTALLSTHTAFQGFFFHDLTSDITRIEDHWKKENFSFDAIYSGYLGSKEQVDIVSSFIDSFRKKDTLVVVDPAMADFEVLLITTSDLDISLLVRAENEDAAYDVLKKAFEL